jgi:hypothetical protein
MTHEDVGHCHISEFPKSDFRTNHCYRMRPCSSERLEFHYHDESPRALFSGSLTAAPNMPPDHAGLSPLPYIHQCRQLSMNIVLRAKNTEREKHATAVMTL